MVVMEKYTDILLAIGLALLVGLERGWHLKDESEGKRIAGIRTFAITGIFSALSVFLAKEVNQFFLLAAFLCFSVIVAVVVYQSKCDEDRGITTEISLLATFVISALAAYGHRYISSASAVLMVILLSLKPQLHSFIKKVEFEELIALIKFLVLIAIVYPVLPDGPMGSWTSIGYRDILKIVIVLSFISFSGYIAIKLAGAKKGVFFASLLGGLVSSTAVTINLSKYYKENANSPYIYIYGILTSWSVMFFRVVVLAGIFNLGILREILIVMFTMVLGVLINLYIIRKRIEDTTDVKIDIKNPIDIISSVKFALLLSVIIFLAEKGKELFGKMGLVVIAIFSGLSDVDAITVYMSKLSIDPSYKTVAIFSIFVAVVINTLVKCGITFFAGGKVLGLNILKLTCIIILVGSIAVFFIFKII